MFRTRIRELRESAGYKSQKSFADAFGVAQSTVGNWEAGTREPNHETVQKLADFFLLSQPFHGFRIALWASLYEIKIPNKMLKFTHELRTGKAGAEAPAFILLRCVHNTGPAYPWARPCH